MKRVILALALVALFVSCSNKEELRLREQHLKDSFNTLLSAATDQKETLEAQMKDIDDNLMKITSQYAALRSIATKDGEISDNVAEHIKIQINAITDLLAKDKSRIASIQAQLSKQKNDSKKAEELQAKVNELNNKISESENQIATLTNDLKDKNIQLNNLNEQVAKLQQDSKKNKAELSKLEDERYTGYFFVGTKKELKQAGLIDTKGGFIGIGKTITMANNGDISAMKKVDTRNLNEIPLTGQKVQILTNHPANSYVLQGSQSKPSSLMITSVDDFWKLSRCLVIMVK